jgi:hypothetical protein
VKQKPSINLFLFILIFTNINTLSYAQNRTSAFPRLEPDPKALEFFDISKNASGITWQQLAQMSLWASGDTSVSNFDRISSAVRAVNSSGEFPASDREKAEFILNYMHKNILKSYSLYQTRVDVIFSNGRFNCVSSAVLYMILCKSAGINTSGVVTKEHAFIIVHAGGQNYDVETTNPYGFDPGNRKDFLDSSGKITGFAYVPPQNYRDRQTINQVQLVSLVFNNIIADHERQNRYNEAVPVAVDMAALLCGKSLADNAGNTWGTHFEDPRKGLMDRLLNFGGAQLKAGREEDALRWAADASALYPDELRWQELSNAAVNNYITKLLKAGKTEDARSFLEKQKKLLTANEYGKLDALLLDTELLNAANKIKTAEEGEAIVNIMDIAHKEGRLPEKRSVELLTFAIQKTASILSAAPARNWRAAVIFIENNLARFGQNRELEQALKTYRDNLAADYHNRFAAEWNKKNYEEAERILNEGLAEFPSDRRLLTNRETVNKSRGR